jgi:hypothetical protein
MSVLLKEVPMVANSSRLSSDSISPFPVLIGFIGHILLFLFAIAWSFQSELGHDLGGFLLENIGLPAEIALILALIALLTIAIRKTGIIRLICTAGVYGTAVLCWLPALFFAEQFGPDAAPRFLMFWAAGMLILPASIFIGGQGVNLYKYYLVYMLLLTVSFVCIPFELEPPEICGLALAAIISITIIWEITKMVEEYSKGEVYCASLHLLASATTLLPAFYNVKALASHPQFRDSGAAGRP